MGRAKNEYGLTPQQEAFCQYVVDAYGNNPKGILVKAYQMAYNCKSDAKIDTHYSRASNLAKHSKVRARINQLREEQARLLTISRDELISEDVELLRIDPLDLWILDAKTNRWRMRYIHEIPKKIRGLLKFEVKGSKLVPIIDRDAAKKRLIDLLGYASAKDVNISGTIGPKNVIRIGFDDDDEN